MISELPTTVLIDKSNYETSLPYLIQEMREADLFGFDIETQDEKAHEGLKQLRESGGKDKVIIDYRRSVITGFSIYCHNSKSKYYINLAHKDVENRLPWEIAKTIFEARKPGSTMLCHNAVFEITMMANCLGFDLKDVVCTLQLAVSAYGPDEYPKELFIAHQFGRMKEHFMEIERLFNPQIASLKNIDNPTEVDIKNARGLNKKQQDLLSKLIGKETHSDTSYNGFVKEISYGYNLKKVVKSFFNYQMKTYKETLGEAKHMGELTGAQTADYGADDAYWVVPLFFRLISFMTENCPNAIEAFMKQENPMTNVYSDIRRNGMVVNTIAIIKRRDEERKKFAQTLREMKATIRCLSFRPELDKKLAEYDDWYGKAKKDGVLPGAIYRQRLMDWANSPDDADDFKQACQVSSPVSNAWAGTKCMGLSITHYYQARLLMYDLTQMPVIIYKGKTFSDGEARGEIREKLKTKLKTETDTVEIDRLKNCDKLLGLMGELASIEQRMKLYLTPYQLLTDPQTGRMYPEVSSLLASRRMACQNPNGMQLAKRGESTYVRGFYHPDNKDEVMVSLDWSQVELVLIGELSGDPYFAEAYAQLPYKDLHLGAAADILSVGIPEVTADLLKNMHNMKAEDLPVALLTTPNGDLLTPGEAKKFWRVRVGKGANFNYWYSGALSTVGELMGWTSEQMWAATDKYRQRFEVAEEWRVKVIADARETGEVQLPDGHRRYRFEATHEWAILCKNIFDNFGEGVKKFGYEFIKAIKNRAGNQIVNSVIQGTSATLAKRSILRINAKIKELGLRATFKLPVHDELIFSVHRDDVIQFIKVAKECMANHPEIVKKLKLYSTASIGLTFEPFHAIKAPTGQIELDEAPAVLGYGDSVVLDDTQILGVIDYLFKKREELEAA